jgi:hypothetical protein
MRIVIMLVLTAVAFLQADEGMYPMSEIQRLNLQSKGLEIPTELIFSEDQISLSDAIVNVGGCTGSFISADGLILTNQHCAFGAAQAASDVDNDYVTNGFIARERSAEIPARGYTVRITQSFKNVSAEVLDVIGDDMDFAARTRALRKKRSEIEAQAEADNPGLRAEVAEMFIGKTYVLFLYTYIKDVRLVYIPERDIGEFGGETDNWIWPRHTADFALMRAYVGKDGQSDGYAADNVPYQPKNHLKINPAGVSEEDFVMILGYPGRTYRHRTASFYDYEANLRMPYIQGWYAWQIDLMNQRSGKDANLAVRLSTRIKRLANTEKNYRGKILGITRAGIIDQKKASEAELTDYINADVHRRQAYGDLLSQINDLYTAESQTFARRMFLEQLRSSSHLLSLAHAAHKSALERAKPDTERESWFQEKNRQRLLEFLKLRIRNYDAETDRLILAELLSRAVVVPGLLEEFAALKHLSADNIEKFTRELYASRIMAEDVYTDLFDTGLDKLAANDDPALQLMHQLMDTYEADSEANKTRKGKLDSWYGKLLEVQQAFIGDDFIPDANSTFRLTYGYIRGYTPQDAVFYSPITTLRGVMEKNTGQVPFKVPQKLQQLYQNEKDSRFYNPKLGSVPVCILYNMDTTGGNSGSPVLNAKGELIGLNFDRAFEATINDFAWNESYSRSIGVDIRYLLYLLESYAEADDLLQEMTGK